MQDPQVDKNHMITKYHFRNSSNKKLKKLNFKMNLITETTDTSKGST